MIKSLNNISINDLKTAIRSGTRVSVGGSPLARGSIKADTSKPRANKYGNKKIGYDGHEFDSVGECDRYRFLKLLERGGVIEELELQPVFELGIHDKAGILKPARIRRKNGSKGAPLKMKGDFRYKIKKSGLTVIEDFKGKDTSVSRLKRAWVELLYDVQIEVVKNASQPVGGGHAAQEAQAPGPQT